MWGLPWPCLHEFLAVVTHPRIYAPPSTAEQAATQVDAWLESPTLSLLHESPEHWQHLRPLVLRGQDRRPPCPRRADRGTMPRPRRHP